jgi:hypothetical protein
MTATLLPMPRVLSLVHEWKQPSPMTVTLLPIVTDVSAVHE